MQNLMKTDSPVSFQYEDHKPQAWLSEGSRSASSVELKTLHLRHILEKVQILKKKLEMKGFTIQLDR